MSSHADPTNGLVEPNEGAERTRTAASAPTPETHKSPQRGIIYVVQAEFGGPVKIGYCRQNGANRKRLNRNNRSGVMGVQHVPHLSARKPWRAQITCNRRNFHLGLFATEAEAVAARRAAEIGFGWAAAS